MTTKPKIFKNITFLTISRLVSVLFNFFLFPFFVHHLGTSLFGIYLLIVSFTSYFSLLDLGVGTSLLRFIAQHQTRRDTEELNRLINTIFFFYAGIGFITALGFVLLGWFLPLFKIDPQYIHTGQILAYILAASSLISWPFGIFNNVLGGAQRYDLSGSISILVGILTTFLNIIIILSGYGIIALALTTVFCNLVGNLLSFLLVKKIIPSFSLKTTYFRAGKLRNVINFSIILFLCQISSLFIFEIDKVILGIFVSTAAITLYEASAKIQQFIRMLENLIGTPFIPAASELESTKQYTKLKDIILTGSKFVQAIILPVTTIFILLAKPFLTYWLGLEFGNIAFVAQVFIFFWLVNGNADIVTSALIGIGRLKEMLIFAVIIALSNFVISIVLVQKLGILGVVLGTTIPFIIGTPIYVVKTLNILKIPLRNYIFEVITKAYFPLIPLVLFLLTVNSMRYPRNLLEVGLYSAVAFLVYLLFFFFGGLKKTEQVFILKILHHLLPHQ